MIESSERVYSALLRLYPRRYRDEFGEEMRWVFSECLNEARRERGSRGVWALWLRVLADTGQSVVAQQIENLNGDGSMNMKNESFIARNRGILYVALATALLLMVPLVAMQFSDTVNWSPFDFLAAGVMLFGAGLAFVLIARRANTWVYRAATALAVGTALFMVWSNLAVGIIGNEDNPANLMYLGVLGVGFLGSLAALFRPAGMARAMLASALANVLVTGAALVMGLQHAPESSVVEILAVNGFFIILWLAAAILYRHAGNAPAQSQA